MRVLVASVAAVAVVLLGAPAGASTGTVDLAEVADELRNDFVYVDTDAERAMSEDDADDVRSAIRSADTPVYLAVLPASAADAAGGDPGEVASQLAETVARPGTYGVVVGVKFRAGSSVLSSSRAGELAKEAVDATGDDTATVLIDFVERVADEASSGSPSASGGDNASEDGGGIGLLLPLLLIGAAVVGVMMWRRAKQQRAAAEERARAEEADRQMLRAELSVLADDVVRLDTEVQLHPDAQSDFDAAVNRYRAAETAVDYADEPVDLVRVARVVAEAQYLMDRVKAVIAGREPPSPPEELQRTGDHGEPALTLDENRQPVYVGYQGGFQGGWFGGMGGGLISGLLLGSMFTGGFGGWGYGGGFGDGGGGDGGGGGDFGGGDFGGGDFGGGDFGGGI
ncbi:MAG: hypothetical protein WKF64_11660 [Ilumatobacteraceae bacterium]